jgi:hypothetical protein
VSLQPMLVEHHDTDVYGLKIQSSKRDSADPADEEVLSRLPLRFMSGYQLIQCVEHFLSFRYESLSPVARCAGPYASPVED